MNGPPDPGRVLRRALLAWGLGHLALGATTLGWSLVAAEIAAALVVAWLTIGLADTSAYLVPFLAGMAFLVAWAWQAIDAYQRAHRLMPEAGEAPERSAAAAIGWLSLPLLVWATGFWVVAGRSATPGAALDTFISAWTADDLDHTWPSSVSSPAHAAARTLGDGADRFHDVRITLVAATGQTATAVAQKIHFERRPSRLIGLFEGTELVPVVDERLLDLELRAVPVELPGGGDIGAVRWDLVSASTP